MLNTALKKSFYLNTFSKNFTTTLTNNSKSSFLKSGVVLNFIFLKYTLLRFITSLNSRLVQFSKFTTIFNNLIFFSILKNFIFYKNFSKFFFMNFVFYTNFYTNNVYLFSKSLFFFINRFVFLKHDKFKNFKPFKRC